MPQDTSLTTREHFPALQQYVYLNAASIAMVPAPVRQKQEEYEREIGSVGTVSLDEEAESRATDLPRRLLADLFGTEESRIALVSNATEALSHLAWGIRPQRGTNVVVIDLDFPSTVYPWMRAAQDTGAEVRLVRAMEDPRSLCIEDIAAAVDDDTTAVCISEVQYATGHRFDLGLLAELAHDAGALCIVDGTQSAGVVPVDVEESDVDAFVASGYKWLCAPFGAAAMYVHPRLMGSIDPPIAGWRSTSDIFAFDATRLDFIDDARKFHAGTPSYGAMFALGEIARYLLDLGVDRVFEHVLSLTQKLRDAIESLGAEILTPADDGQRAGIVAARFPGRDGAEVAQQLNDRGVIVASRLGAVRFAPHFYNNAEDIDRAVDELHRLLR